MRERERYRREKRVSSFSNMEENGDIGETEDR